MNLAVPIPESVRGSALPRTIDLSYPSNRYAVGASAASALAARLLGGSWAEAALVGVNAFAAWACARELDPDHAQTATVALPLAAAAAWMGRPARPLAAAALLSGVRALSGTTGRVDAAVDLPALAGLTALAALSGDRAAALPVAGAAALTPGLEKPWVAALALLPGLRATPSASVPATLVALAALLAAPRLAAPEAVTAEADQGGRVLPARVRRSRQVAGATVGAAVVAGQAASVLPLAVAALAVGLRRAAR